MPIIGLRLGVSHHDYQDPVRLSSRMALSSWDNHSPANEIGRVSAPRHSDRMLLPLRSGARLFLTERCEAVAQQSGQPCGDRLGRTRTVSGQPAINDQCRAAVCEGPISGDRACPTCQCGWVAALITSAPFSAIMMTDALVLPETIVGMIDASTTRSPSRPRTRNWSSTTAIGSLPILHVPMT